VWWFSEPVTNRTPALGLAPVVPAIVRYSEGITERMAISPLPRSPVRGRLKGRFELRDGLRMGAFRAEEPSRKPGCRALAHPLAKVGTGSDEHHCSLQAARRFPCVSLSLAH